jgi:hypothetical protein
MSTFVPDVAEDASGLGARAHSLWANLPGSEYLAIVLESDIPDTGVITKKMIGRLRLVGKQSTVDLWEDHAPIVCRSDLSGLESWQYDYVILWDRTSCGRAMLAKHGDRIDKRRNSDHPAWAYARPAK